MNILIADDEIAIRELVGEILEGEGHEITLAEDGQDALYGDAGSAERLNDDLIALRLVRAVLDLSANLAAVSQLDPISRGRRSAGADQRYPSQKNDSQAPRAHGTGLRPSRRIATSTGIVAGPGCRFNKNPCAPASGTETSWAVGVPFHPVILAVCQFIRSTRPKSLR